MHVLPRPTGAIPMPSGTGKRIGVTTGDLERIKWIAYNKGYQEGYITGKLTCDKRSYGAAERDDACDSLNVCLTPTPKPPCFE